VGGQPHALAALPPGKTRHPPGDNPIAVNNNNYYYYYYCTEGWVSPRAGLDVCENLAPTVLREIVISIVGELKDA
jgi:hypothetical protein